MLRFLVTVLISLVMSALGLLLAAWLLPDVHVETAGFLVAVVVFTAAQDYNATTSSDPDGATLAYWWDHHGVSHASASIHTDCIYPHNEVARLRVTDSQGAIDVMTRSYP